MNISESHPALLWGLLLRIYSVNYSSRKIHGGFQISQGTRHRWDQISMTVIPLLTSALPHSRTGCWRSRRLSMESNIFWFHANKVPIHGPTTWWLNNNDVVQTSTKELWQNMFHCHFISPMINWEASLKAVVFERFVAGICFPFHRGERTMLMRNLTKVCAVSACFTGLQMCNALKPFTQGYLWSNFKSILSPGMAKP